MMFMHQEGEAHKQQHDGHDQQQQQHQVLNESDEDAALAAAGGGGDGQSLHSTLVDYAESDLREVDADTKLLIAQLTDLDVSVACNRKKKRVFFTMSLLTIVCSSFLTTPPNPIARFFYFKCSRGCPSY